MKSLKPNQTVSRRKYDTTFKLEAVQNWLSSGKSAEVVAEELGLSYGKEVWISLKATAVHVLPDDETGAS